MFYVSNLGNVKVLPNMNNPNPNFNHPTSLVLKKSGQLVDRHSFVERFHLLILHHWKRCMRMVIRSLPATALMVDSTLYEGKNEGLNANNIKAGLQETAK